MKKSVWKYIAAAGVALVCTMTLAACGGGSSSDSGNGGGSKATASAAKDETKNGTLTVWTASNTFKANAEKWAQQTGKKVKVVVIPTADLDNKLKQSVGDASTAPDVLIVSRDYVKEWEGRAASVVDYTKTYAKDAATYKKNAYPSIYSLGTVKGGDLVATSAENPVGMMFYNRKIAKDILGTDDPTKVGEAMNSVSKWKDVNAKIKAKYGSSVKLFGNTQDTRNMMYEQRTEPFVKNNTFTVNNFVAKLFDSNKMLYTEKMFVSEGEDAAYESGYDKGTFFCEFLPSWGFSSKIMPQIKGKASSGNWGATTATYPSQRGGSFFFVTKTSKMKGTSWKYIKSQTIDTKNGYNVQKSILGYSSSKVVDQKLADSNYEEPMLGNQQIFAAYHKQAAVQEKAHKKDIVTEYDASIVKFLGDLQAAYGAGHISRDDALKKLGDQVKTAYPQLEIKYTYDKK